MMKSILYSLLLTVCIINILSCSKKNMDNEQTIIKPSKFLNGYFSIFIPKDFKLTIENNDAYAMIGPYGSAGDIFKYGNTVDDTIIKLHFNFGKLYEGNGIPNLHIDDITYYYQKDSIINIDSTAINNFPTARLITFYNHKNIADTRLELFAFSNNPKAKLQVYSLYALNPAQLSQVKSIMKSVQYFMP